MDEAVELPLPKRQRKEQSGGEKKPPTSSRLFAPFRTLGLVTPTSVPFTSVPLGKTTFQITTSVGDSLQTYDLRRGLNLVFLSRPPCPGPITATHAYRDRVFVAWGGLQPTAPRGVWVFKRGQLVGELETGDTHPQEIRQILVFGAWIVGCGCDSIEVWKSDSYEHYTSIASPGSLSSRTRGSFTGNICTLPTFLNKVFVGTKNGSIEVFNVSTGRFVHTILASSSQSDPVTALSPAPAVGLLAVARADGSIDIVDIEAEEPVLELRQRNSKKPITCITFRTDGMGAGEDGRKDGIMATASIESGDITMWDLNRGGRVTSIVRGAHETSRRGQGTGINKIEFLPGQPVLVSSGLDNALTSWVFDQIPFSPTPRKLHSRSGHSASIARLRFLPAASDGSDAAGKWLLSASQDRSLWGLSLRKDGQSTELSQGAVAHKARKSGLLTDDTSSVEDFKAPPIIDMACSLNRDGGMGSVTGPTWSNTKSVSAEESSTTGWESIVTAHVDDKFARTWSWGRKKAGRWAFETGDHKPVTSVAITTCGTFAVVGSAGGSLDMFNLQSGAHRQRYPPRLTPAEAKQLKIHNADPNHPVTGLPRGHRHAITGIVVDTLNRTMLTTSLDSTLIFWDFLSGKILQQKTLTDSATPTSIRYNPISGLIAISCDDLCIRIIDIESRKVVRELWGCTGQIYDHCFSYDGRWIVAGSMDSVVRVFDLATGHLIDAFKTSATCTNLAFSSTGEFLATTHAGSPGVFIWTNKALFRHVSTRQIDDVNGIIDLSQTTVFSAASQLALDGVDPVDDEEADIDGINALPQLDQLDKSLLTLSLQPQSQWQTLLNLDSIRARNKPILPPEKPKAAPFFLGTSASLTKGGGIATNGTDTTPMIDEAERSRISRLAPSSNPSQLSHLFQAFSTSSSSPNLTGLTTYLTSLPPSSTDLEIRSLTLTEMPTFITFLTALLRARKSFELVNTWMAVFLRMHGEFVSEVGELRTAVLEWRDVMREEEERLGKMVGFGRGVVEFLRSAR